MGRIRENSRHASHCLLLCFFLGGRDLPPPPPPFRDLLMKMSCMSLGVNNTDYDSSLVSASSDKSCFVSDVVSNERLAYYGRDETIDLVCSV